MTPIELQDLLNKKNKEAETLLQEASHITNILVQLENNEPINIGHFSEKEANDQKIFYYRELETLLKNIKKDFLQLKEGTLAEKKSITSLMKIEAQWKVLDEKLTELSNVGGRTAIENLQKELSDYIGSNEFRILIVEAEILTWADTLSNVEKQLKEKLVADKKDQKVLRLALSFLNKIDFNQMIKPEILENIESLKEKLNGLEKQFVKKTSSLSSNEPLTVKINSEDEVYPISRRVSTASTVEDPLDLHIDTEEEEGEESQQWGYDEEALEEIIPVGGLSQHHAGFNKRGREKEDADLLPDGKEAKKDGQDFTR